MAKKEHFVDKLDKFKDGDRRIVVVGATEIGLFKDQGQFYAYSNRCLHQGGPACEGMIISKVEEKILPDGTSAGSFFFRTGAALVLPGARLRIKFQTRVRWE